MLDKSQSLKIAFLTDIHLSWASVPKLTQWVNIHYNTEPKFDYIFIGGDTGNCNHDRMDHSEEEQWEKSNQMHQKIREIFGCKMFFVPGNHDCKLFFEGKSVQGFYNVHKKRMEISGGLDLIGFGGSMPGYESGKEIWSGYPYKDDADLVKEWEKCNLMETNGNKQVILLTHVGPSQSSTTMDQSRYPQRIVTTGSQHLNKYLGRKEILCWFHGHTHRGSHWAQIAGTEIINPGSLSHHRFMYVQLVKQDGKWRISRKSFEIYDRIC